MPYYSIALIYLILTVLTFMAETPKQNILVGIGWIGCSAILVGTLLLVRYTNRKMYKGKANLERQ